MDNETKIVLTELREEYYRYADMLDDVLSSLSSIRNECDAATTIICDLHDQIDNSTTIISMLRSNEAGNK